LTAGWMRSLVARDTVQFSTSTFPFICIVNQSGALSFNWFVDQIGFNADFQWVVSAIEPTSPRSDLVYWWDTAVMRTGFNKVHHGRALTVRYWSIVIPLTLLTAFLLLSKPRSPQSGIR